MRCEVQTKPELRQLAALIENMGVAMLTTLDAEGALVSRPMSPLEFDAHGALWFFTDLRSSKVEHLRIVNVSFADAERSTYVSLSGRGEIHAERGRVRALWTPLARPWFPDGPDSTDLALLKFLPDSADYWDAPDSKMVRLFALAASLLGGAPVGLGEHGHVEDLSEPATVLPPA